MPMHAAMLLRLLLAVLTACCAVSPAAGFIQPAATAAASTDRLVHAHHQTLLARAGFSPGLIDGRPGRKTRVAVEGFQRSQGLAATGTIDEATLDVLRRAAKFETAEWTRRYVVRDRDVTLVTGAIPEDWNERATIPLSGYAGMHELLAERGWCSADLVSLLNPGVPLDALTSGDEVTLPNVPDFLLRTDSPLPRVASIEIDLGEKLVTAFDQSGAVVAIFHCSIAQAVEKRPVGDLSVKVVVTDPDYTFNPASWPEVTNVTRKLRIAPGPRNPVGVAWIGLDKPGYGLHGTVRPQDIGKTGSHGCFRLANWDAARLARAVSIGTPVVVRE
jgi:lipoprotein-anchoring transpeptidase ErfK/SrfK